MVSLCRDSAITFCHPRFVDGELLREPGVIPIKDEVNGEPKREPFERHRSPKRLTGDLTGA